MRLPAQSPTPRARVNTNRPDLGWDFLHAPEVNAKWATLQFRAGSKGPALIHFLTKRCMFGRPFGRPDRPPARGPCALPLPKARGVLPARRHVRRRRPTGTCRASFPRPAAARDVGFARRASRCGCIIGGHARKDATMFRTVSVNAFLANRGWYRFSVPGAYTARPRLLLN